MIWIIYTIWVIFITVCVIIENRTENGIGMFLLLVSLPIMFYIPFMV